MVKCQKELTVAKGAVTQGNFPAMNEKQKTSLRFLQVDCNLSKMQSFVARHVVERRIHKHKVGWGGGKREGGRGERGVVINLLLFADKITEKIAPFNSAFNAFNSYRKDLGLNQ